MIKTLLAQVKEYKTPSLLAPLCAALEVFFRYVYSLCDCKID